jgi:hypothetical protein
MASNSPRGGQRPGNNHQKAPKEHMQASLRAPDAQQGQQCTTAAATNRPAQHSPKGGRKSSQGPRTPPRSHNPPTMRQCAQHSGEHAAEPVRRARRKTAKQEPNNKELTLRALAKAAARFDQRCGAQTTCKGRTPVRPPAAIETEGKSKRGKKMPNAYL